ncbi:MULTISPECIES: alpha/beta hydrolase [unclassified Mesorhizobium]|uniref:alpha/beta fold hydrolase n=1 Tax=unclassified Mesorhizobium TaxID=325217 RepID=UPI001AEC9A3A|nr:MULTISPECIES: alpha/beta hydrolase [unclassified Mesorhizobium]
MCKEAKKVVVLKSAGFPQHGPLADEGRSHRVPRNGSEPNWRMQRPQRLQRSRRVICGMVEWQDLNLRPQTEPSWYLLSKDDQLVPPAVARMMAQRANAAIVEVPGSHATFVAHPAAAAKIIEQAAEAEAKCEGRAR